MAGRVDPVPAASAARAEATERLFGLIATAAPQHRAGLEEQVVILNMDMATSAVRRFQNRGVPIEDIEQVAYIGLVKAVKGFDPARGYNFLAYAVPTIRGEVRRYFRDHGWTVRPPRSIQETQTKIIGCEAELYQRYGRAPKPSELAEHLGADVDLVVEALGATGCFQPTSLDSPASGPASEGHASIGERIRFEEHGFGAAEARALLEPVLARLSRRERLIVELRFFRGLTQAEIGTRLGVTQMQVSRLLTRILEKLRHDLGQPDAA